MRQADDFNGYQRQYAGREREQQAETEHRGHDEPDGRVADDPGDTVLLGDRATLKGLYKSLRTQNRWRAIHLACHGVIDPERPLLSELALTGEPLRCLDIYRMKIPADLVVFDPEHVPGILAAVGTGVWAAGRTTLPEGSYEATPAGFVVERDTNLSGEVSVTVEFGGTADAPRTESGVSPPT